MVSDEAVCFICNTGKLLLTSTSVDIPHFGEVSITTFVCSSCGYRSTDVLPVRSRDPARYSCTINGPSSLSIRVIRSHTGTISIPEMGIRIDPGVAAEGFVSNAEGILNRVEGILDQVLRDSYRDLGSGDPPEGDALDRISRCLKLKDMLSSSREGKCALTLVIEDPNGNSAIAGNDPSIRTEPLSGGDMDAMGTIR
jgi:zinc finger protein